MGARGTVAAPSRRCPAWFISSSASGQGKTTVTAALARLHRRLRRRVRVFKAGPDFLDPMILARASGNPVYQLDLWMGGEPHCRELLYAAAGEADVLLIEGVMGLFDGTPSSADLARAFGVPVLAVIDGSAMAQTFGAVAHGLAHYRANMPVGGVLANRVAGQGHADMLRGSLGSSLRWYGALPQADGFALPSRHLGLLRAGEIGDLDERLDRAASTLEHTAASALPPAAAFAAPEFVAAPRLLEGVRIAVARDAAFCFVYQANLDLLRTMGAELRPFSPLTDEKLPEADSLYLPGGYPELYLAELAGNAAMRAAVLAHQESGKPLVAECGGMLYLFATLSDTRGGRGEMVGALLGHGFMEANLQAIAMQMADFPEGGLRGHTFHQSRVETPMVPAAHAVCPNGGRTAEAVYRQSRLVASYAHWYFPSNPAACAALFKP